MRTSDYSRIERAILDLEKNFRRQPRLDEMARAAGLSAYHFQRLFTRWVGISPKRFLQFLTAGYAGRLLRESANVLDAAYGAGLSGPGRLHDLFVNVCAATPGEVRSGGAGLRSVLAFPAPAPTVRRKSKRRRSLAMTTPTKCPKCKSEHAYQDRDLWVCPECGHEWSAAGEAAAEAAPSVPGGRRCRQVSSRFARSASPSARMLAAKSAALTAPARPIACSDAAGRP